MSDYRTSNSENARELYIKRGFYGEKMLSKYENLIDFFAAEKYLYGRVDRSYVPMEISPTAPMMTLQQTNRNPSAGFQVLDFVGRAFQDLSMQFRKKVMAGEIRANDPVLTTLEVQRGYTSPRTLFRNFQITNKETMRGYFHSNELNFSNFDEFLVHFSPALQSQLLVLPFTYPAFLKSRHCPMNVNGLVIDIFSTSCANDQEKIDQFRNSPNWEFYLNACRSYGFSVDFNNPGRLIADIGTPEMIQYARHNNFLSTNNVIAMAYVPAHRIYYESFKQVMLDIYNTTKKDYIEVEYCQDGTLRNRVVKPKEYTIDLLNATYPDTLFLQLYMRIRLAESPELKLTKAESAMINREIMDILAVKGSAAALDIFEARIGETYNNSGSLTQRVNSVKIREEDKDRNIDSRGY